MFAHKLMKISQRMEFDHHSSVGPIDSVHATTAAAWTVEARGHVTLEWDCRSRCPQS